MVLTGCLTCNVLHCYKSYIMLTVTWCDGVKIVVCES